MKKEKVFHIPDHLSFNAAALSEPVACCIHAVDRANIRYGDTVVIFGAGSMAQILGQLFKASNAEKVYMIAGKSSKLELAAKYGIIPIEMDRNDYSVHEKALLKENPLGVDLIIDATGSTKVISESMKLLKKGGTLLQYAIVHSGEK